MPMKDRRRHPRAETSNTVSYVCVDKSGSGFDQGMGRTVNISQGGMLLETFVVIESKYIIIATIDLEGSVIQTKGKVAYSKRIDSGQFLTGIRFLETPEKNIKVVTNFIKTHYYRQNNRAWDSESI
jgi:c-di-GMP-binding flagellar brake protein YcgR